jgi:hypothetical protein
VKNEAVALIETAEEETTEATRAETDKVDDSIETTEATEATTVTVATGIVQSVKIQTSHSEPNATDAGNLVAVEDEGETMTVVAVETTVDTRAETDKVDDSIETTGATEETTVTVAIGIVQSVKIQTSHSEPNATDAGNLAVVAVEDEGETMTVVAVETTVVTEVAVVEKSTMTTIGIVQSVKIQTSHSEPNATDAGNLAVVAVEAVDEAMTVEVVETTVAEETEAETVEDIRAATDKVEGSIETTEATEAATKTDVMATGIVQSVKIQISHSEPNATDAAHHVAVAVAVAVAVDLVGTPEIDLKEATLEDDLPEEILESDHQEEKAIDHQEGTVETDVMNVGIKTADHTIKIVLEATSVNQNANLESHAHFANPEETVPAMPITDLRNH